MSNTASATGPPANTPGCRGVIAARLIWSVGTVDERRDVRAVTQVLGEARSIDGCDLLRHQPGVGDRQPGLLGQAHATAGRRSATSVSIAPPS